ncbi:MAG: response regulator transcription factor [Chloroflexi bacterium]|nr:response regulator transcription factor [Chloroflexota bacterium]
MTHSDVTLDGAAQTLRVLIAESVPLVRRGLLACLEEDQIYTVTGAVDSCQEALNILQREEIDLLIACVELVDVDGFALVARARRLQPSLRCLILSETEDEKEMFRAMKVGAVGYLSKLADEDQIRHALRDARQGRVVINPPESEPVRYDGPIEREMREIKQAGLLVEEAVVGPTYTPLSPRELEVLRLIAQGCGNKDIAGALSISDQTVKNHITAILRKLSVNDRTAAAIYALKRGWITDPERCSDYANDLI